MKHCLFIGLLLLTVSLFAQEKKPYRYYDKDLKETLVPREVVFYSELEFDQSIMRNNVITFALDGTERKYEQFSNYTEGTRDGVSEEKYPDGSFSVRRKFVDGKEEGNSLRFWSTGQIKRSENFADGILINTKCFGRDGTEVPVYPLWVRPEFPGGTKKFGQYLVKNIQRRNMQKDGKITASFVVNVDGTISDIIILRTFDPLVNEQMITVLKKCPLWIPGMYDGEPVAMRLAQTLQVSSAYNKEHKHVDFTQRK